MDQPKFYLSEETGATAVTLSGAELTSPKELTAETHEGAAEKHLPVVTVEEGAVCVNVGSVPHPMTEEHSIEWVYVQTSSGGAYCRLSGDPEARIALSEGELPVAAYAYCNLHGLWKTEL